MDIDNEGATASNKCMVWALETVQARAEAGDFSPPIHKELGELITGIGAGLARLYLEEYQVLPYIYTHLVSLSCFTYLIAGAFLKGLYFEPAATWVFGFTMPMVSLILQVLTIFGLLHIGSKLANPLSAHKESFAVCHFVNYTASASLEIVATSRAPTLRTPEPARATKPAGTVGGAPKATDLKARREQLEQTYAVQALQLEDAAEPAEFPHPNPRLSRLIRSASRDRREFNQRLSMRSMVRGSGGGSLSRHPAGVVPLASGAPPPLPQTTMTQPACRKTERSSDASSQYARFSCEQLPLSSTRLSSRLSGRSSWNEMSTRTDGGGGGGNEGVTSMANDDSPAAEVDGAGAGASGGDGGGTLAAARAGHAAANAVPNADSDGDGSVAGSSGRGTPSFLAGAAAVAADEASGTAAGGGPDKEEHEGAENLEHLEHLIAMQAYQVEKRKRKSVTRVCANPCLAALTAATESVVARCKGPLSNPALAMELADKARTKQGVGTCVHGQL